MMMRDRLLGWLLAAALLATAACGAPDDSATDKAAAPGVAAAEADARTAEAPVAANPALAAVIAAAKREGKLVFVNSLTGGPAQTAEWERAFEAYYGFDIEIVNRLTSNIPSEMSKVIEEFRGGRQASADVVIGSETHVASLIEQGAARAIDWNWSGRIGKLVPVWGGGGIVPAFTRIPGLTYSTERVPAADVPRTMAAFARSSHPVATTPYGSSLTHYAQPELWGEAKALAFVQQLSKNADGVIYCGDTSRILSGEFDIFGPNCGINEVIAEAKKGAPVGYVIPSDAPVLAYLYYAVPKNSARPNAAALWINFMHTPQAQRILYKYESTDYHRSPGSKTAEVVDKARADGLKFVEVDVTFIQRRAENIARLRKTFQKILQEG